MAISKPGLLKNRSQIDRAVEQHIYASHGAVFKGVSFDATVEVLVSQKSQRTKEVLRARDEFLRLFYDGTFENDADNTKRYFMQFAVAARTHS